MASFKKPNMSRINSELRKLKSACNDFERKSDQAIRDLKEVERQAKSYQMKLHLMSTPSLISVPSLYLGRQYYDEIESVPYSEIYNKDYDVFISHASEDKDDVARPLAEALAKMVFWFGMMNLN